MSAAAAESRDAASSASANVDRTSDVEGRAAYLASRRQKLLERRAAEREAAVAAFEAMNPGAPPPPVSLPKASKQSGSECVGAAFRKNLAERLKREVVEGYRN